MTPVYKSPDESAAKAIQKLLADHNIETSVIETRNAGGSIGGAYIKWFELWLRKQSQAAQAKVIITQFEFTSFRKQKAHTTGLAIAAVPAINQINVNEPQLTASEPESKSSEKNLLIAPVKATASDTASDYDEVFEINQETIDLIKELDIKVPAKRREELIPINNKRVFKRLGLLLGYSEQEIEEFDRNKLYRPWDSSSLMEKIAALKQKCR